MSDTKWTVDSIRQTFVDYFKDKHAHTFVPSSGVILPNDPTLLFANAGMNQFKPIFLGTADPNSDFGKLKRAANSQKCIRAGGKHNDLKDVGKDSYHHTFFEMLGSWSFGDYFKKECIAWAWELLTEVYKLDQTRLYATYFKGDESLGLEPDEEAHQEWLKYLPEERILPAGAKENFWEMGATGPCGPCSEIHYDKVGNGYGLERVNQDDPLVIEIWNLVFMQYVREEEGGSLKPLPAKHIDTGMGLERLASILMQVPTNYDIDLFQNLINEIQRATGCPTPYSGKYGADDTQGIDMAYRIVADHIRTITVAISDGALPSNVGSGYVLRRVIRRAVRYGFERLGEKRGFFSELAPVVVRLMGDAYPSLRTDPDRVAGIIRDEELQFSRTLRLGLKKFHALIQGKPPGYVLPAEETARLYHTFGFPFDLTRRMAKESGMQVDKKAHLAAMEANAKAEVSGKKKMDLLALHGTAVADLVERGVAITNDTFKYHPASEDFSATLVGIWCGRIKGFFDFLDESFEQQAKDNPDPENPKNFVGLIFDRTNFYAEQGGQTFDTGRIFNEHFSLNVESVQVYGGYVVHYGTPVGEVKTDDVLRLQVDFVRRAPIASNHTSTHLCNHALRRTLGAHVDQQGSLVLDSKFRFDFTHNKPLEHHELHKVDTLVRDAILTDAQVHTLEVPLEVAMKIRGVRQMFGEKYPDPVRIVAVGVSIEDLLAHPENVQWDEHAIEFCGGTHATKLSDIQSFVTISEDAISKGVRRVVCLTGQPALEALEASKQFEAKLAALSQLSGAELSTAVGELLKDLDSIPVFPYADKLKFRAALADARKTAANHLKDQEKLIKDRAAELSKVTLERLKEESAPFLVLHGEFAGNVGLIKTVIKNIQKGFPTVPVLIVSSGVSGKLSVVSGTDKGHSGVLPSTEWVNAALAPFNGKGGGNPLGAQGTCSINSDADIATVVDAATAFAKSKLPSQ